MVFHASEILPAGCCEKQKEERSRNNAIKRFFMAYPGIKN
jgi:hypothetical protein